MLAWDARVSIQDRQNGMKLEAVVVKRVNIVLR
jgi:hypothetical protein